MTAFEWVAAGAIVMAIIAVATWAYDEVRRDNRRIDQQVEALHAFNEKARQEAVRRLKPT